MKKYKLKKWYPSLLKDVRVGDIITENGQHYKGVTYKGISYRVEIWQLHPDFWELIEEEKPLFITEDGVEVSDKSKNVISIDAFFNKCTFPAQMFINENREHGQFKAFYHESNADEYILRNKRLFSYNEIWKYAPYGSPLSIFEQLAKERIEQ